MTQFEATTGQRAAKRVVVVAASAGGLRALLALLGDLPGDFPACILVVQHVRPQRVNLISEILNRGTPLRVEQAQDLDQMAVGTVYVAPPDFHLLAGGDNTVELSHEERVNFLRPAADVLFASVAARYGAGVIAVVLSGTGPDGTRGMLAVKKAGGITIAQDEATCDFFGMAGSAIDAGCVDMILPLRDIAPALVRLLAPA